MGLDIGLKVVTEVVVDMNITHNLGKMWQAAGIYEALYLSEGKTAKEILPTLKEGLAKMIANPEKYHALSAGNGWGTYRQAVPWLIELIEQFELYPDGKVWVCR